MRTQPFFNYLSSHLAFDLAKINYFATNVGFAGGWEGWLQCEIAAALRTDVPFRIEREKRYESKGRMMQYDSKTSTAAFTNDARNAARADFFIETTSGHDQTHFELKCIYAYGGPADAWKRFGDDVKKIQTLSKLDSTLNAIAILGTFGVFRQQDMQGISEIVNLNTSYVIDFGQTPPNVTPLANVAKDGVERFFIVGYGIL